MNVSSLGKPIVELEEQLVVRGNFLIHSPRSVLISWSNCSFGEIEAAPVDVLVLRHPAQRAFDAGRLALGAADNPLQDPHVVAKAGPEEVAFRVAAEPVDAEDSRRIGQACGRNRASDPDSRPCDSQ